MPGVDFLAADLARLEEQGQLRKLRRVECPTGPEMVLDGRRVVCFSSNDYLGLASNPDLINASCAGAQQFGAGTGASRLICGNQSEHSLFEQELAAFHQSGGVRLFNSGYHANVGTLAALAGEGDVIFSDALNHASIIDGARLSRARIVVYPHADTSALRSELKAHGSVARRRFIVSESVFSMDGDRAPLAELAELARLGDALLYIDEAHAVGALGPGGRGAAAEVGVRPDVLVGTLGKSFGSFGAYVSGPRPLAEFLLHRARSFVFTTGLPAAVVAASRAALRLISDSEGEARRARLGARIEQLRHSLDSVGLLAPGAGNTPVFPIVLGDERTTMRLTDALLAEGLYVQGIRPPTVPAGSSRLRISVTADHSSEHIEQLISALKRLFRGHAEHPGCST